MTLQSGTLQSGALQSPATDFGSGEPLIGLDPTVFAPLVAPVVVRSSVPYLKLFVFFLVSARYAKALGPEKPYFPYNCPMLSYEFQFPPCISRPLGGHEGAWGTRLLGGHDGFTGHSSDPILMD